MVGSISVSTEDELKAEAANFKREKEAEKKRRQRAGTIYVPVPVTTEMVQWLFDEGLLPQCKRKDLETIGEAIAEHLRRRSARIRGRTSWQDMDTYYDDRPPIDWEAGREQRRAEDLAAGLNPDHWGSPQGWDWKSPRKSGCNGRNPGFLHTMTIFSARGVEIGRAGMSKAPGTDKKIKQLSEAELKQRVAPIERKHGKLTLPDKEDAYTAAKKVGGIDYKLDQMEAEDAGYAKKVNTSDNWRLGGDDKDDRGSKIPGDVPPGTPINGENPPFSGEDT
jgi:hypothetical protein